MRDDTGSLKELAKYRLKIANDFYIVSVKKTKKQVEFAGEAVAKIEEYVMKRVEGSK